MLQVKTLRIMTQSTDTHNDRFATDLPLLSAAIARLRLPLIIGVVLIHSNVPELLRAWNMDLPDSTVGMAHAIGNISLLLDRVVTPVFFAISGFLFFLNIDVFTPTIYRAKLRRRVFTLLLPYVVWNVIFFFLHSAKTFVGTSAAGDMQHIMAQLCSLPTAFWDYNDLCPADLPLWFVRDLIIVSLFTPLIHLVAKGWRAVLTLALLLAWLWLLPDVRAVGINPLAFFYFTLGATFSINRLSPIVRRHGTATMGVWLLVAIAILAQPLFGSILDEGVRLVAVVAVVIKGLYVSGRPRSAFREMVVGKLSAMSFFIYAAHALFASAAVRLMLRYIPISENLSLCGVYVLSAFLTFAVTVLAYCILRCVSPCAARVLNGNR